MGVGLALGLGCSGCLCFLSSFPSFLFSFIYFIIIIIFVHGYVTVCGCVGAGVLVCLYECNVCLCR